MASNSNSSMRRPRQSADTMEKYARPTLYSPLYGPPVYQTAANGEPYDRGLPKLKGTGKGMSKPKKTGSKKPLPGTPKQYKPRPAIATTPKPAKKTAKPAVGAKPKPAKKAAKPATQVAIRRKGVAVANPYAQRYF